MFTTTNHLLIVKTATARLTRLATINEHGYTVKILCYHGVISGLDIFDTYCTGCVCLVFHHHAHVHPYQHPDHTVEWSYTHTTARTGTVTDVTQQCVPHDVHEHAERPFGAIIGSLRRDKLQFVSALNL